MRPLSDGDHLSNWGNPFIELTPITIEQRDALTVEDGAQVNIEGLEIHRYYRFGGGWRPVIWKTSLQ